MFNALKHFFACACVCEHTYEYMSSCHLSLQKVKNWFTRCTVKEKTRWLFK